MQEAKIHEMQCIKEAKLFKPLIPTYSKYSLKIFSALLFTLKIKLLFYYRGFFFYFQKFKQISTLPFNYAPNPSKLKTSAFNLMMNFCWRLLYNRDICPRQLFDLNHQHNKCPKVSNQIPQNKINIYIYCVNFYHLYLITMNQFSFL